MIACSLIYENCEGFFWKHNAFFQESNPAVLVDDFDFNRFSFREFIQYLERQGVREYYFIGGAARLERVVAFLRRESTIGFYRLSLESDVRLLSERARLVFSMLKPLDIDFEKQHLGEFDSRCKNGVYQLMTGRYPAVFNRHLIKHLLLESPTLAERLDASVYMACAINSVLYCQSGVGDCCETPLIFLPATFLNELASTYGLGQTTKSAFIDKYEQFVRTGNLDDGGYKGFVDMAFYFDRTTLNVLYIDNEGIYKDFSKTQRMATRPTASFYELLNALSLNNHKIRSFAYDDMFSICLFMKPYLKGDTGESVRFYLVEREGQALQPFRHLVGIEREDGYRLYDSKFNKLYTVNAQFIKRFKQLASSESMRQLLMEKFL